MQKPRVRITRRLPARVETAFRERFDTVLNVEDVPLDPAQLIRALQEFDAIVPTVTDRLDASAFEADPLRTKIIANYGVGFNHIDVTTARVRKITVTNTPDVLSDCTADLALTLLLMTARRAGEGDREIRAGNWTGWRPSHMMGVKVTGKTLGIVGFGRIGQKMAQKAHFGFGMRILAQNSSRVSPEILAATGALQLNTLEDLLRQSDFVSLHCPGGAKNKHLINAKRLALMKPESFLINTARGDVIDETALARALKNGTIRGAGLDVFEDEPRVHEGLLACENAVLLPHLGSATDETREAMGMRAFDNICAYFNGGRPPDQIN